MNNITSQSPVKIKDPFENQQKEDLGTLAEEIKYQGTVRRRIGGGYYDPSIHIKNYLEWVEQPEWKVIVYEDCIIKHSDTMFAFPNEFKELCKEIEDSKYILELSDNWDGEGAKAYLKETWYKMIEFLRSQAIDIFNDFNQIIRIPKISHGPEGSIDLYWDDEDCDLLLNIPEDDTPASFFGEDKHKNTIRGLINLDNPQKNILLCLTK